MASWGLFGFRLGNPDAEVLFCCCFFPQGEVGGMIIPCETGTLEYVIEFGEIHAAEATDLSRTGVVHDFVVRRFSSMGTGSA